MEHWPICAASGVGQILVCRVEGPDGGVSCEKAETGEKDENMDEFKAEWQQPGRQRARGFVLCQMDDLPERSTTAGMSSVFAASEMCEDMAAHRRFSEEKCSSIGFECRTKKFWRVIAARMEVSRL